MTAELTYLVWTMVLALVQIALVAALRTAEVGLPYNASPRDMPSPVPLGKITARLVRAQNNLFETLPVFIGLILAASLAQIHTDKTVTGAMLYFWARVAYVPIYAFGILYLRTLVWAISVVGLIMIVISLL